MKKDIIFSNRMPAAVVHVEALEAALAVDGDGHGVYIVAAEHLAAQRVVRGLHPGAAEHLLERAALHLRLGRHARAARLRAKVPRLLPRRLKCNSSLHNIIHYRMFASKYLC